MCFDHSHPAKKATSHGPSKKYRIVTMEIAYKTLFSAAYILNF